jgi:hypothetical protein
MALDKDVLKASLIVAFSNPQTFTNVEQVADAIATAIHAYIIAGDVTGICPPNGGPLGNGKVV